MQEFLAILNRGEVAAAEDLLAAHPELVTGRDEQGASWLALAVYYGQPAIARLIAARRPLDWWEAAMLGEMSRLEELRAADPALLNAAAPDGFSALALAVFFGQPAAYRYLLQEGADVNQPAANAMRVAPIHAAVARGDKEAVALLLTQGADPNARQQADWTGLHAAAASGNLELAHMLIVAGADREACTDKGETAQDLARTAGHEKLAELLAE